MGEVKGIEKMLQFWEDTCAYTSIEQYLHEGKLTGGCQNWNQLRKYLLESHDEEIDKRFICDPLSSRSDAYAEDKIVRMNVVAAGLYSWNKSGRRVFQISPDLMLLLAGTRPNIPTGEINWPFPAFVISWEAKENEIDTLLALTELRDDGTRAVCILGVSSSWQNLHVFTKIEANMRDDALKTNRRNRLERLLKTCINGKAISAGPAIAYYKLGTTLAEHKEELSDNDTRTEVERPIIDQMTYALNIVAGLALYLETLPPGSPHKSAWSRIISPGKPDPRAISKEAEVCHVNSQHVLSAEERRIFREVLERGESGPLSAHFRCGHWRRPPGHGKNAAAEKTVHVRPTLVRADRLADNELPGGSIAHVR